MLYMACCSFVQMAGHFQSEHMEPCCLALEKRISGDDHYPHCSLSGYVKLAYSFSQQEHIIMAHTADESFFMLIPMPLHISKKQFSQNIRIFLVVLLGCQSNRVFLVVLQMLSGR